MDKGGFFMPIREEHITARRGRELRQTVTAALALAVLLFFLPLLAAGREPLYRREEADRQPSPEDGPAQVQETAAARDRGRIVRLKTDGGQVEELTMEEYLWGVVAAEMPASFEEEALKAQACAARTYTVTCQDSASPKHPDADLCADSTCCQAYIRREDAQARWGLNAGAYTDKIQQAVAGTDGLGVLYEGEPIQALFFSSAAGKTVDAVEVWGNEVDYLKSVDSPEGDEVPNYRTQVVLTAGQVKELTLAAYPGADLSGDPSGWFGQAARNEGGGVISIPLGGVTLTGGQVRALFSLRSASFSVSWDGSSFTFDVTGYGHGVGMSQYGANAMARAGSSFQDILTWYYTGAQVGPLW